MLSPRTTTERAHRDMSTASVLLLPGPQTNWANPGLLGGGKPEGIRYTPLKGGPTGIELERGSASCMFGPHGMRSPFHLLRKRFASDRTQTESGSNPNRRGPWQESNNLPNRLEENRLGHRSSDCVGPDAVTSSCVQVQVRADSVSP